MRGLAWSTLFGIVLALLIVFFAGVIVFGIGPKDFADQSLCSNTGTALRMFSYFDGVTVASPDDPTGIMQLCPPRIVSIGERMSDARISERVGDELVICQNSFGGGQVNLFRDEGRGSLTRYCGLCSKIDFEKDSASGDYVEGFEEHISTHIVSGTDQTIGEILNSDLPRSELLEQVESGEIDPGSVYSEGSLIRGEDVAILYIYDKRASRARNVFEAAGIGAIGGFGLGSAAGAPRAAARVGRAVGVRLLPFAGRAVGTVFGGFAMVVAQGAGGAYAGLVNENLYTDEWVGGVVMIPWDWLYEEIKIDGEEQNLSSVLGCQQSINFVDTV